MFFLLLFFEYAFCTFGPGHPSDLLKVQTVCDVLPFNKQLVCVMVMIAGSNA